MKNLERSNVDISWATKVTVGGMEYVYRALSGDHFVFNNSEGRTVFGRLFGEYVGSNSTGQGLLAEGTSRNETSILDQSTE